MNENSVCDAQQYNFEESSYNLSLSYNEAIIWGSNVLIDVIYVERWDEKMTAEKVIQYAFLYFRNMNDLLDLSHCS